MFVIDNLKLITEKPIFSKILSAILFFLLIFQLINFVFILQNTLKTNTSNLTNYVEKQRPNQSEIMQKLNITIFGTYMPEELGGINIKQSLLDLEVIGVMFSKNTKKSEVILRFPSGIEKIFKIGDIISDGLIIKNIMVDGVIISREGVLEVLNLKRNKLIFDKPLKPLK